MKPIVRVCSITNYYLGYCIHSCNKMRYKAAYRPSELLCPLRYQWVSFDIAKPSLDRKRYVVLFDISTKDREPLPLSMLENNMEEQHTDLLHDGQNDILTHENEDMVEMDFEDSDDNESGLGSTSTDVDDDGYVGEVYNIGLLYFQVAADGFSQVQEHHRDDDTMKGAVKSMF